MDWIFTEIGYITTAFLLVWFILPRARAKFRGGKLLTLAFNADQLKALEQLRVLSEKTSFGSIVTHAVAFYHFLWVQVADGASIVLRYADGTEHPVELK